MSVSILICKPPLPTNSEVILDHTFQPVSAIQHFALPVIPATQFQVTNLIILHVQQGDQSDLFFFALRSSLFQQCNRAATFYKAFLRIMSNIVKIIMSEAIRIPADHVLAPFVLMLTSIAHCPHPPAKNRPFHCWKA